MKVGFKRRWVAVVALLATAAAVALVAGPAGAYKTHNNHKLTYGISGQRYWLAPGAVDNNENAIVTGVGLWNATSTPASYSRTYTQSASRMDFYYRSTAGQYCAITYQYVDTTVVDPDDQNWWWGKVYTTPDLKVPVYCGNADHRKAIVAHEQGHVMGLAHATGSSRLMYTWLALTDVNAPTADDVDGINFLY